MATFKTRARAVDMLGRQQIAGIPTAISELFKNAHDAYADHAEIDYYRSDRLFVLRDDGVGMTKTEFEERWLVLGTESKLGGAAGMKSPFVPPGKSPRPVLGEKGIGRLSIASVSPQLLVLSQANREDQKPHLVAAFIHWGVFEIPGVNLEEIAIPVRSFPAGDVPDREQVRGLVRAFKDGLKALGGVPAQEIRDRLARDLDAFDVDPRAAQSFLPGPDSLKLSQGATGTHFYLKPADEVLDDLLTGDRESEESAPLVRTLIGFSNTMTPGHPQPRVETAFREHKSVDQFEDRIASGEFFTPDEFRNADHHFEGSFDASGAFEGAVTIYGERQAHKIASPLRENRSGCGPFDLDLAYVMGRESESTLPDIQYGTLIRKLNSIGGLYVYRDNVRILPYGDPEFDFLGVEDRRSRHAGYYFFSYRRMFGAVTLTRERNGALHEKAGREGFIQGRAYADFREILRNFLSQIAADFFRKTAPDRTFENRREEVRRGDEVRNQRDALTNAARSMLSDQLADAYGRIDKNEPFTKAARIVEMVKRASEAALDHEDPAEELGRAEAAARTSLDRLRQSFKVERPQGIGLTGPLTDELDRYGEDATRLEAEAFRTAESEIEAVIAAAASAIGTDAADFDRLAQAVNEMVRSESDRLEAQVASTVQMADDVNRNARRFADVSRSEWTESTSEAVLELADTDPSTKDASELRTKLIRSLRETAEHEIRLLAALQGQLDAVVFERDPGSSVYGLPETLAAVESELYALRDRDAADSELVRIGQALNVIDHELGDSVASIRDGLRRLKRWADSNPDLKDAYDAVRTPFEYLDSQLKLFTPLQRRLYRSKVKFAGSQIATFLNRLFEQRLGEVEAAMVTTEAFMVYEFDGYPSSVYPAFVNLVDNAVYWIRDASTPRVIRLDSDGISVFLADSGPGIAPLDMHRVFEAGFTRKRFGRGLGLALAKRSLAEDGYELSVAPSEPGWGATFKITPFAESAGSTG